MVLILSSITVSVYAQKTAEKLTYELIMDQGIMVSKAELDTFAKYASKEIQKDKEASINKTVIDTTYNFITVSDDDITYLYEEDSKGNGTVVVMEKKEKIIAPKENENVIESQILGEEKGLVSILNHSGGFIGDGVGGRVKINGSSASYLSTLVTPATPSQILLPSGTNCPLKTDGSGGRECMAWIYGGFGGTIEADMGVVYDPTIGLNDNEKGYKAFLTVTGGSSFVTGYNSATYKNGYLAGNNLTHYYYRNISGKIRLKVEGLATCADSSCSNSTDTNLISIMEATDSHNLSSVSYWKIVTTVTSLNDQGKNQADFALIKLDGTTVPSTSFQTAEKDHTQVTRDTNLKYSFRVDHSLY